MRNETNIPFFQLQDMKINKAQKNRAKQDQLSALVHPHIRYQLSSSQLLFTCLTSEGR
jgi:hypothetical protein